MQSDGSLLMLRPAGGSEADLHTGSLPPSGDFPSQVEESSASSSHHRRRSSLTRRIRISPSPTRRSSTDQRRNSLTQNPSGSSSVSSSTSTSFPSAASTLIPLTFSSSDPIQSSVPRSLSPATRQSSTPLAPLSPSPARTPSRVGVRSASQGLAIHRARSTSVPRQSHLTPVIGYTSHHGSSSVPGSPLKLPASAPNSCSGNENVANSSTPALVVAAPLIDENIHTNNAQTDGFSLSGSSTPVNLALKASPIPDSKMVLSSPASKATPPVSKLAVNTFTAPGPPINILGSIAHSPKSTSPPIQSPNHSPSSSASFHTPSSFTNPVPSAALRPLALPVSSLSSKSPPGLSAPPMSFSGDPTKPSPEKGSPLSMSNFEARGSSSSASVPIITSLSRSPSQSKTRTRTQNNSPSSKHASAFDYAIANTATPSPDATVQATTPLFRLPLSATDLVNRSNKPELSPVSPNGSKLNSTPTKLETPRRQVAISPKPTLASSLSSWFKKTPPRQQRSSSLNFEDNPDEHKHASPREPSPVHFHQDFGPPPPSVTQLNFMTTSSPVVAIAKVEDENCADSRSPILAAISAHNSSPKPARSPALRTLPPSRAPPAAPSSPLNIATLSPRQVSTPRSQVAASPLAHTRTVSPKLDPQNRISPPSRPPPPTPRALAATSTGSEKGSSSDAGDTLPSPRLATLEQSTLTPTPPPPQSTLPRFLSPITPKLLRPKGSPLVSQSLVATPPPGLCSKLQPMSASRYQFSPSVSSTVGPSIQGSPIDSMSLDIEPISPHERGRSPVTALSATRPNKPFGFHNAPGSYPPIEYEDAQPEVSAAYPSIHYEYEHKEGAADNLLIQPSILEQTEAQEKPLQPPEGHQSLWRFFSATGVCIVAVIAFTIASLVVRPPGSVGPIVGWALLLLCQTLCLIQYLARKAVPKPKHPSKAVQLILQHFHTYAQCESLFILLPSQNEGWLTQEDFRNLLNKKIPDNFTQSQILDYISQEFETDEMGNINAFQILNSIQDHTRGNRCARTVLRARLGRFAVPVSCLPLIAVLFEITTLILQACVLLTSSIPSTSIYIFGAVLLVIMAGGSLFLREMARVFPPFQWLGIFFLVVGSFLFTLFCLSINEQDTLLFFAGFIPQVHSFVIGVSVCSLIAYHDEKMGKNHFLDAFYTLSKTKNNSQVHKSASLLTLHNPPGTPTNNRRGSIHSLHETKRLISDSPFQNRRVAPMVPLSPVSYKTKTRNAANGYRNSVPSPLRSKPATFAFPAAAPAPATAATTTTTTTSTTTSTSAPITAAITATTAPVAPVTESGALSSPAIDEEGEEEEGEGPAVTTTTTTSNTLAKALPLPVRELRPRASPQRNLSPKKPLLPVSPPPIDPLEIANKPFRSQGRSCYKGCFCELCTLQGLYRLCAVIVAILAILIGLSVGVRLFEGPRDCGFPIGCNTPRYVRGFAFVPVCECDDTFVDLSEQSLVVLPSLAQFTRLQSLSLTSNLLAGLPSSLCSDLPQLAILDVTDNKLQSLPTCFEGYTSLISLNVSSNALSSLPSLPPSLLYLNASSNALTQLPPLPSSIRSLDLSFNYLHVISLPVMGFLGSLDLSHNQIVSLPETLLPFPHLLSLSLAYNGLTSLPTILRMPVLRVLDCGNNMLGNLSDSIGDFTQLQSLNLASNKLTSLPLAMTSLQFLHTINLSNNLLRIVPSVLMSCSSLTVLCLSFNQLHEVPSSISNLPLEVLELDSNQITQLPVLAPSLVALNISNNSLQTLPLSITSCQQLQQLDASMNVLTTVPSLQNITRLRTLYLSYNRLSSFPVGLTSSLQSLIMTHNLLNVLPDSFLKDLSQLTSLDVSNNGLSEWPSALSHLPLLQSLKLSFNQITTIPAYTSSSSDASSVPVEQSMLKEIFLDGNKLSFLPLWFTYLRFLQTLSVNSNNISSFLDGPWSSSSAFHTLSLSSNQLTRLPLSLPPFLQVLDVSNNYLSIDSVTRIKDSSSSSSSSSGSSLSSSLLSLNLANNNITLFPQDLSQFRSLTFLSLAHNHLSFPSRSSSSSGNSSSGSSSSGSSNFPPRLLELDLTDMGLTSLPSDLSLLPSLRRLVVGDNVLTVLPAWICGLQSLFAANNSIETLQFVGGSMNNGLLLPRLEVLDLSSNEISGVNGDAISLLPSLQQLNLAHNWIFSLPSQFVNLNNLQFLSLSDNPICRDLTSSAPLSPALATIMQDTNACSSEPS